MILDPRIIEFLTDHKDGSFLLCQANRAGVWQWFCKMSATYPDPSNTFIKRSFNGFRYDGDPESAIEHVLKQYEEATKGRAA